MGTVDADWLLGILAAMSPSPRMVVNSFKLLRGGGAVGGLLVGFRYYYGAGRVENEMGL